MLQGPFKKAHWHSLQSSKAKIVGSCLYILPFRVFLRLASVFHLRCRQRPRVKLMRGSSWCVLAAKLLHSNVQRLGAEEAYPTQSLYAARVWLAV